MGKKISHYLVFLSVLTALFLALDFFLQAGGVTLEEYVGHVGSQYFTYLPRLTGAVIVIFIAKILIDLSSAGLIEFFEKIGEEGFDIIPIYRYASWALALVLSLSILIEDLSTFVMSVGLIGFGLTFALQTPISCFVAWVMIVLNKPYRINDRITVGGNIEGDVVEVNMFYTTLRELKADGSDLTGRLITFPNNMLLTVEIINYTRDVEYVWDEVHVSVTYESDRELAEKIVYECTLDVVKEVMDRGIDAMKRFSRKRDNVLSRGLAKLIPKKPQMRVELADSCFIVGVRYITSARRRRRIRTDIYRGILDRFRETDGVEIAYPHMEVVMNKGGTSSTLKE